MKVDVPNHKSTYCYTWHHLSLTPTINSGYQTSQAINILVAYEYKQRVKLILLYIII